METSKHAPAGPGRPHPLLLLAALAVVLFCLVGSAAIMGWLPSSVGGNAAERQRLTEAERAALASQRPAPPGSAAQQAPQGTPIAPAPAPAPVQAPPKAREPVRLAEAEPAHDGSKWCADCGNVESVRTLTQRAQGSGIGAAGGAILGGLLGNQVGGGHGKQLATVAGAVGGAVVGNQVEGSMKASHTYEIRVRLDDGTLRTFHQSTAPDWRAGQRVRIVKGKLLRPDRDAQRASAHRATAEFAPK